MNTRVCPKCNKKLTKSSNYFCTSCGTILPDSLTLRPEVSNVNIAKYEYFPVFIRKNIFSKISGSRYFVWVFLLIAISLFLASFTSKMTGDKVFIDNKTEVSKSVKSICDGELICGFFAADNISSVVPENIKLFVEAFDYKKASQFLLDYDNTFADLINELDKLDIKHFAIYVESINGSYYWTAVLPSQKEPSTNLASMMHNPQKFYVGRYKDYYIVSSRSNVMSDIQKLSEGVSKNLSKNSNYVVNTKKSKEGQVMLMVFGSDNKDLVRKILDNQKVSVYLKNMLSRLNLGQDSSLVL